jgi:hypothetical protein
LAEFHQRLVDEIQLSREFHQRLVDESSGFTYDHHLRGPSIEVGSTLMLVRFFGSMPFVMTPVTGSRASRQLSLG